MESIFTESGAGNIIRRIDSISPTTKAAWGKMDAGQMLAHCQKPLNVGLGTHQLGKYNFFLRAIGKMVKNGWVKDDKPIKHNQPTDKSFRTETGSYDFEAEKTKLKDSVNRFSAAGKADKLPEKHPFFGPLNQRDWDIMQWKHLDHHLRQFGV